MRMFRGAITAKNDVETPRARSGFTAATTASRGGMVSRAQINQKNLYTESGDAQPFDQISTELHQTGTSDQAHLPDDTLQQPVKCQY